MVFTIAGCKKRSGDSETSRGAPAQASVEPVVFPTEVQPPDTLPVNELFRMVNLLMEDYEGEIFTFDKDSAMQSKPLPQFDDVMYKYNIDDLEIVISAGVNSDCFISAYFRMTFDDELASTEQAFFASFFLHVLEPEKYISMLDEIYADGFIDMYNESAEQKSASGDSWEVLYNGGFLYISPRA
jgi:hypothetical protein